VTRREPAPHLESALPRPRDDGGRAPVPAVGPSSTARRKRRRPEPPQIARISRIERISMIELPVVARAVRRGCCAELVARRDSGSRAGMKANQDRGCGAREHRMDNGEPALPGPRVRVRHRWSLPRPVPDVTEKCPLRVPCAVPDGPAKRGFLVPGTSPEPRLLSPSVSLKFDFVSPSLSPTRSPNARFLSQQCLQTSTLCPQRCP
jgi:hypothetical protein